MKALTRLIKELEDQLSLCMRCGMCQAVCPIYEQTGHEGDVARGKLALLDGLRQEMFKNPKGVYERLNRCLLCGSCGANCPSGVNVLEIFMKARMILTSFMGLSPVKRVILRGMLSRPETFDSLMTWGSKLQKFFTKPVSDGSGTSCARFVSPLLSNRHFIPLVPKPFHQILPFLQTEPCQSDTGAGIKVAFFTGCLIDKIFPQIAQASIDVLKYHGVGIFMPQGQGCCGIPAISSGDMQTFKHLVGHNLERFGGKEFDYMLTSCSTCAYTLKKVWPLMARDSIGNVKAKIHEIARKTMDINQFLVSVVGLTTHADSEKERPMPVTYHDPCHLKKSLGVSVEPRALISTNHRYYLKEMHKPDACCGMGGNFNLQYYGISANIGKQKCDSIMESGCSIVATGCPACMIQISDMLSRSVKSFVVKHPVEIYRDSLKSIV